MPNYVEEVWCLNEKNIDFCGENYIKYAIYKNYIIKFICIRLKLSGDRSKSVGRSV